MKLSKIYNIKRLTKKNKYGTIELINNSEDMRDIYLIINEAICRLYEYENTGLTPEEINTGNYI